MLDAMSIVGPAARLRRLRPRLLASHRVGASAAEFGLLITIGVTTALLRSLLDLRLGVPGHSIVLVVPPLVFGLACVPRRMAGAVMGSSALAAALLVRVTGISPGMGSGALASLFLTGIFLDVALSLARGGGAIYALCLAAGLASNTVAFTLRFALKSAALSPGDAAQPLSAWWPRAIWTYALCGALAGLVSAAVLFRARPQSRPARRVRWKLWSGLALCAAALGLAALAVSRTRPAQSGLGEAFSRECGERLGRLAARCLPPRSRVAIISGELGGTRSRHRRAELAGLSAELQRAGLRVGAVLGPRAGTADLDPESGGTSADLLLRAAREAGDGAVVSLAGLPARVPEGFGEAMGTVRLLAYVQEPSVAQRWAESGLCAGLLLRAEGAELFEWEPSDEPQDR